MILTLTQLLVTNGLQEDEHC